MDSFETRSFYSVNRVNPIYCQEHIETIIFLLRIPARLRFEASIYSYQLRKVSIHLIFLSLISMDSFETRSFYSVNRVNPIYCQEHIETIIFLLRIPARLRFEASIYSYQLRKVSIHLAINLSLLAYSELFGPPRFPKKHLTQVDI